MNTVPYHPYFSKTIQDMLRNWAAGQQSMSYEEILEKIRYLQPWALHTEVTLEERCFFHKPSSKIPMRNFIKATLHSSQSKKGPHVTQKKESSSGGRIYGLHDTDDE